MDDKITKLPDGSAFFTMSFPLPKDHWLYRENFEQPFAPLPQNLYHLKPAIIAAAKYAVRGATNNGKIVDFDPDAILKNLAYYLFQGYDIAKHD